MPELGRTMPRRLPSEPLYTVSQLAELWGASRSHIYNLVRSGRLASVAIGRTRRIRASAADQFLNENSVYVTEAERRADAELRTATQRLIATSRAAQGLSPRVDDVAVLDRVAEIVTSTPVAPTQR